MAQKPKNIFAKLYGLFYIWVAYYYVRGLTQRPAEIEPVVYRGETIGRKMYISTSG